jgi:hypothetical protein
MCLCGRCADRFLYCVSGSDDLFRDYCRDRHIAFRPGAIKGPWQERLAQWTAAVGKLPENLRNQVEREQDAVVELSGCDGCEHLLDIAGTDRPPSGNVLRGGSLALWFLLNRCRLFWDVFFHHVPREADPWHAARARPGVSLPDPAKVAASLAVVLLAHFGGWAEGLLPGAVVAHTFPDGVSFVAHGPRLDGVGNSRQAGTQRPPLTEVAQFVYYPRDGTVLLHSPFRAVEQIRGLLTCFGREALGSDIVYDRPAFALERLRLPFHPLPDADDMELVRVKALRLSYPARCGRRKVMLETLLSDGPAAIDDLLRLHVGDVLDGLVVDYAELHARLLIDGRCKDYLIRLWPDRCDLGRGAVGDRFLALLRRWDL